MRKHNKSFPSTDGPDMNLIFTRHVYSKYTFNNYETYNNLFQFGSMLFSLNQHMLMLESSLDILIFAIFNSL